jgi:hypothetical protein
MNAAPPPPEIVTQAAAMLSAALDRNDFATAARLITPDCRYEVRGDTLIGAPAIITSYAESNEWAIAHLDEVRYESEVGTPEGDTVAVRYTDYLMKAGGGWHRHRCRQHLTVNAEGRIARIVHEDLPGEVEALDDYFERCGIRR